MADFARGELLVKLRNAKHKSREDAAHEIGVTTKTLYTWEHGGKIKWPNAQRVGKYYGVDPETLVSREVDEEPTDTPDLMGSMSNEPDLRAELAALHAKLDHVLTALGFDSALDAGEEAIRIAEEAAARHEQQQPSAGASARQSRRASRPHG